MKGCNYEIWSIKKDNLKRNIIIGIFVVLIISAIVLNLLEQSIGVQRVYLL